MKLDIFEEKENTALERKEIRAKAKEFEKTPSREEIVKAVIAQTGADANKIVVDKIEQEYGKKEALVRIKVYSNEDALKKYEREYKIARTHGKSEKKEEKKEGEKQ